MLMDILNDFDILLWILSGVQRPDDFPQDLYVQGHGPFVWQAESSGPYRFSGQRYREGMLEEKASSADFVTLPDILDDFWHLELSFHEDIRIPFGAMVVGRMGWSPDVILEVLGAHVGHRIRIFSEEMLLAYLLSGKDPFNETREFILQFAKGHPALEFLQDTEVGFDWPNSSVQQSFRSGSDLGLDFSKSSLPGILGYRVGDSSPLSVEERQRILDRVIHVSFTTELYDALGSWYLDEWGQPGSQERLEKLAVWLSTLCKLDKRKVLKGRNYDQAVADREADLRWLKQQYYRGYFRFRWPSTEIEEK